MQCVFEEFGFCTASLGRCLNLQQFPLCTGGCYIGLMVYNILEDVSYYLSPIHSNLNTHSFTSAHVLSIVPAFPVLECLQI